MCKGGPFNEEVPWWVGGGTFTNFTFSATVSSYNGIGRGRRGGVCKGGPFNEEVPLLLCPGWWVGSHGLVHFRGLVDYGGSCNNGCSVATRGSLLCVVLNGSSHFQGVIKDYSKRPWGRVSNQKYAKVMVPEWNQKRSDNSGLVEDEEGAREGVSLTTKCRESRKLCAGDSTSWNQGEIHVSLMVFGPVSGEAGNIVTFHVFLQVNA